MTRPKLLSEVRAFENALKKQFNVKIKHEFNPSNYPLGLLKMYYEDARQKFAGPFRVDP